MIITVIIPIRNNPKGPGPLLDRLIPVLEKITSEWKILFIDDASEDVVQPSEEERAMANTREILDRMVRRNNRTGWIGLKQNAGQQTAVLCGLTEAIRSSPAVGEHYIVTMDDDLAHPPEFIPDLLKEIKKGRKMVYGVPTDVAGADIINRAGRWARDLLFRYALGIHQGIRVGSYRILSGDLAEKIVNCPASFIYISAQAFRQTDNITHIEYDHSPERQAGVSSRYSFRRKALLLINLYYHYSPFFRILNKRKAPSYIINKTGGCVKMRETRLHILGGGIGQLSALIKARKLGIPTIVSDMNADAPGLRLADDASFASTFDTAAVTRDGRAMGAGAILATGTDQPVLTAAIASKNLDLPYFLDVSTAKLVTNKNNMKSAFRKFDIPTSPFLIIGKDTAPDLLASLKPPLVIKPLDSQGQRGVYRLDSPDEIGKILPRVLSFSREKEVILEEYYPSREITVSGWVEKGNYIPLTITDRVTKDNLPHIGVCLAHNYPSRYIKMEEEINSLTGKIVKNFGIKTGPIYFQYLIGDEGIRVNEVACRLGGAYEDIFIPWITGVDILEVMIRMTCGMDYSPPSFDEIVKHRKNRYTSLQMFFYRPGIIKYQTGMDQILGLPGILGGRFLLEPGTEIKKRENSTQRAGYFIASGNSVKKVNKLTRQAFNKLETVNMEGTALIINGPELL